MTGGQDSENQGLQLMPVPGVPLVEPGDDLEAIIVQAICNARMTLIDRDIVVVAQKIVSKAEGRYAYLDDIMPSDSARSLAAETEKSPAIVQLILDESVEILKSRPGLIVAVHKLGWVMANAGIDHSNIEHDDGRERVLLLPTDPEHTGQALRATLCAEFACQKLGVVISDSVGRPWRIGTIGMALSAAGVAGVIDRRGQADMFGRTLEVTQVGFADAVAASAVLVMGEGSEALPIVIVRGLDWPDDERGESPLTREPAADLFR